MLSVLILGLSMKTIARAFCVRDDLNSGEKKMLSRRIKIAVCGFNERAGGRTMNLRSMP